MVDSKPTKYGLEDAKKDIVKSVPEILVYSAAGLVVGLGKGAVMKYARHEDICLPMHVLSKMKDMAVESTVRHGACITINLVTGHRSAMNTIITETATTALMSKLKGSNIAEIACRSAEQAIITTGMELLCGNYVLSPYLPATVNKYWLDGKLYVDRRIKGPLSNKTKV